MAASNSINYLVLAQAIADAITAAGPGPQPAVQPVTFDVTDISIHKVTTAAVGTDWVDGPDAPARAVVVRNDTATAAEPPVGGAYLEVRYNGAGQTLRIAIGANESLPVVENANELSFRRLDTDDTPVTFTLQVVN